MEPIELQPLTVRQLYQMLGERDVLVAQLEAIVAELQRRNANLVKQLEEGKNAENKRTKRAPAPTGGADRSTDQL